MKPNDAAGGGGQHGESIHAEGFREALDQLTVAVKGVLVVGFQPREPGDEEIHADDPMALFDQVRRQAVPGAQGHIGRVHQHDGRPLPLVHVVDPNAVHIHEAGVLGSVTLLQFLETQLEQIGGDHRCPAPPRMMSTAQKLRQLPISHFTG